MTNPGTATFSNIRLAEQIFQTQAFIAEDPTTIALLPSRGEWTNTPGGGRDFDRPMPRPAQTFRVSAHSAYGSKSGVEYSHNDDGKTVQFVYDLIGPPTAVVEIGDTWDETADDGSSIHYRVDSIDPSNGYEVCALVTAFAVSPEHGDA